MIKVTCEPLGNIIELPESPKSVVCLTSGLTEAIFAMGCGHRVTGVSSYCQRYIPGLSLPVAGDYLRTDKAVMDKCKPDLILVTGGVQMALAKQMAARGLPVYALPLPTSFHGVLDNIIVTGGLLNEITAARRLVTEMTASAAAIANSARFPRPNVYVELWFGRYMRSIGGRSFIHDIVTMAGGNPVYANDRAAYLVPDLAAVPIIKPDIGIFFQEPEYPVNVCKLMEERGWQGVFKYGIIESNVTLGRNLIHDGPSMLQTTRWLQEEMRKALPANKLASERAG